MGTSRKVKLIRDVVTHAASNYTFHFVNISYLVDNCISPVRSRSHQMLGKNVLSWALTSSVVSIHQVSSQHPVSLLCMCAHAYLLFLFGEKVLASIFIQEKLFGYIQCVTTLFVDIS